MRTLVRGRHRMNCFAPDCEAAGTAWPTILIGHFSDDPPYRIEIPRAVCPEHQSAFRPEIFLTRGACDYMRFLATAWRTSEPDFAKLEVEWRGLDDPAFVAMDGEEARFCAPAVVR